MAEILNYSKPDMIRPVFRSLLIGGVVQFLLLVFASSVLDEGELVLHATLRISAAYWAGVILVLVRRLNALTKGDNRFFRFGLLGLVVSGVPITLAIWAHWGVG